MQTNHCINTCKHQTPTTLGKVYARTLVVSSSSPELRAFIWVYGACIGTAQVGVLLVFRMIDNGAWTPRRQSPTTPGQSSHTTLISRPTSDLVYLIWIAFIIGKSSLEPLLEGLLAQIHVNLSFCVLSKEGLWKHAQPISCTQEVLQLRTRITHDNNL